MKFFDLLLAFAALSSPLWLILLLLPVCIWLAVKLSRRFKPGVPRLAGGVGLFFLLFALPFADEIVGRVYLNYLCATQAGVKVYQTVELPAEYWDEKGKPNFFNQYGNLDRDFSTKKIAGGEGRVERYSSIFNIDKDLSRVLEKDNRTLLGEVITFRFWGGWIRKTFTLNNAANGCQFIHEPEFNRDFYDQLFKPSHSSR